MNLTRALLAPACAVLAAGALTVPAHADTAVACSVPDLVQAINDANTGGGDTLILSPGCTYNLVDPDPNDPENGLPVISSPITLVGNGATIVRDSGAGEDFRILKVDANGDLGLENLTIRGGRPNFAEGGAGVLVELGGDLSAETTIFDDNDVVNSSSEDGGGISNYGTATVTTSLFTGNTARHGGAIDSDGALTVTTSRLTGNHGVTEAGGINNDSSTGAIDINNSRISNNTSNSDGGALDFDSGTITIGGSTITNNTVNRPSSGFAGGIYNNGNLTVTGSSISGNTINSPSGGFPDGGGIENNDTLTIRNSRVSDNTINAQGATSSLGGGIANFGAPLTIDGTALSGNKINDTGSQAGGLYNSGGTVTLIASRISNNVSDAPPGGVFTTTAFSAVGSAITNNIPTNCTGSPVIPTGCVG
ncbi:hypothetical protein [Streptomyces sp. 7N604]|uniref:hypothetical protein n=1 Tax=Streptomyces sp. 7N604 TaxID=3457415 RepID=UPI003FD683AC